MGFGPGAATWEVAETPLGRAWNNCGTDKNRSGTIMVRSRYDYGTLDLSMVSENVT